MKIKEVYVVLREIYHGYLVDSSIRKVFSKENDAIEYALKLAENGAKNNLILYGIKGGIECQSLGDEEIGMTRYTIRCQGYQYDYIVRRMKLE